MLYTESVNPKLLKLLNELMADELFSDLLLVGGTGLALQIGHRLSIDIDLFGKRDLEEIEISEFLNKLGTVQVLKKSKKILIYSINGMKVDFVNYSYPWIKAPVVIGNVRLASKEDIGAMKLNAIAGRGSKKDFIDLYFLLDEFSLKDLFGFYKEKYPDGSEFLVLKSLTYFDDADLDEMPKMTKKMDWEEVKLAIGQNLRMFLAGS